MNTNIKQALAKIDELNSSRNEVLENIEAIHGIDVARLLNLHAQSDRLTMSLCALLACSGADQAMCVPMLEMSSQVNRKYFVAALRMKGWSDEQIAEVAKIAEQVTGQQTDMLDSVATSLLKGKGEGNE